MKKFWQNNKGFIIGIFLLLFFRTAIADWYHVPSGSMQPNVLVGDRVWVNKLAYDVKVPLSEINLKRHSEPKSGDVIVFQSEKAGDRLIKRVIGVPGDTVSMINNQIVINGKPLDFELLDKTQAFDVFLQDRDVAEYFQESQAVRQAAEKDLKASISSYSVRISKSIFGAADSFREVTIPDDHYWVMGDNRDNSADSRVICLVPRNELIGRAERVVVSLDNDNFYLPRSGRYWEAL